MLGLAFDYEFWTPYDAATGHISGKRMHKPMTFTKEWGSTSPKLFLALATNEVLKSVKFEFVRKDPAGKDMVFYTIELTGGQIVKIHQYKQLKTIDASTPVNLQELEEVSLTFRKIDVTHTPSKNIGSDRWDA
jgi:type VI secretion system secreted protein Hcp